MDKVEEFIQHHGIKGMRWGVRRFQPYEKGPGKPKGKFIKKVGKKISDSRAGQEVRSAARELSAQRTKANMNNMSTKDIRKAGKRMQLENEMKRLSGKGSNKKEKTDYRNRGRMSDQEISRKLDRLRAKDLLSQNADKAVKKYVDVGKRVVDGAVSLGVNYVASGGEITTDQIVDAIGPKSATGKSIVKTTINNYKK